MFASTQGVCVPANRPFGLFGHRHRKLPHEQALQFGPADFPASNILCSPYNRLCGVYGAAITLRPCKPALPSFRAQASHASPTAGPADFPASNILLSLQFGPAPVCSPDNRLCRVCGAAITLRPCNSALRTFRRRTSYAPLTTGCAEFAAQQSLCVPANRPCRGRFQSLRNHFASLQCRVFGPADFPASNILCSPDNRLCRVFGAAITLRPCNSALRTFRRRTSYAPLTTGCAEFSAQQSLCVPANLPCRLFGHRHGMLPRQKALRTFRRRTSYAPLTTGSAEFSAQQSLCAPAIRPCGLSGVEHLMLP